MNSSQILINLKGITFRYPGADPVLENLDLKFHRGEKMGLVAPNGSGKPTLLHIIMGLLKPEAGHLEIFGQPVCDEKGFSQIRRRIGLLFQDSDDQLFSPTVSVSYTHLTLPTSAVACCWVGGR